MASDRQNDPTTPSSNDPRPEDHVPGALEHASGEVDEFEAAVAAGAAGNDRPGDATAEVAAGATGDTADEDVDAELERRMAEPVGDLDDDGDIDEDDRALARTGGRETAHPDKRGGPRFLQFLRASWAELQRVQWPDRRQVAQATSVVIGFVIVAGAYLGVADWVAQKVVNLII